MPAKKGKDAHIAAMEMLKKNLADIKEPGEEGTPTDDVAMDGKEDKDAELLLKDATIQSLTIELNNIKQMMEEKQTLFDDNQRRFNEWMASRSLMNDRAEPPIATEAPQPTRNGRDTERGSEQDQMRNEDRSRERRRQAQRMEESNS